MSGSIYSSFLSNKSIGRKSFAVLIDPDMVGLQDIEKLCQLITEAGADYIFVGGSLVVSNHIDEVIRKIKLYCRIPVILFPGSPSQITPEAHGLLYLSLISGRNPELLIGQHVISAPAVRSSGLEVLSTGYMIIDGGVPTTVSYISNSAPIPNDKNDIAVCTAMAGEMQGKKLIFMDAGSGAHHPISEEMISAVSAEISIPLIIGGGIRTPEKAYLNCKAGADVIVVGNAIEKDKSLILEIGQAVKQGAKSPIGE